MELKLSGGRSVSTDLPAFVMGIVNATPDSFWKESRGGLGRALSLVEDGADIIDVGGESTRPGSGYISDDEEIRRVVPVVEALRRVSSVPISIDTRKLSVMKAAFEAGADILNDVSALEDEPLLADFAAEKNIPVILMHKRGIPSTMQDDTSYGNAFAEVDSYLSARCAFAESRGIAPENIIVDPGIGFGKDDRANFSLISRCGELCGGRYRILMALSRKSCIGRVTGRDEGGRLAGTLTADAVAVMSGASMVRVHDVAEAVDSLKILAALGFGGR